MLGGDDGDLGSEGGGGGKGAAKEEAHNNELAIDEPPPGDEDPSAPAVMHVPATGHGEGSTRITSPRDILEEKKGERNGFN